MKKFKVIVLAMVLPLLAACGSQAAVITVEPIDYSQYQNRDSVSLGDEFLLLLKENGNLYTYGRGSIGHISNFEGRQGNSDTPMLLMTDTKQAVALGNNGMALKNDGSLWTWGPNSSGQCGFDVSDINNAVIDTPTQLMTDVRFIAAQGNGLVSMAGGLAIKNDGSLWGWGMIAGKDAAAIGQKNPDITTPFQIDTDVRMVYGSLTIQNGVNVYYYLKNDTTLWACGGNYFGMVGKGSKGDVFFKPVKVLEDVADVSVTLMHVLALKTDGSVWAWGNNECGQIGNGKAGDMDKSSTINDALQLTPYKVTDGAVKVVAGFYSSFALKSDGSVWGWGSNDLLEMGSNDYKVAPEYSLSTVHCIQTKPQEIIKGVTDFTIFAHTGFALNDANELYAWGNTSGGNTGTGLSTAKGGSVRTFIEEPTLVMEGVESVFLNSMITCFIKTDGTFWLSGIDIYRDSENGSVIVANPWQIIFE